MQEATYLRFFVAENRRYHGRLAYEWLLDEARRLGIRGGSAFRAIAGYGRHGVLHEARFIELQGDLPVKLEFVVSPAEADALLASLAEQRLDLFYVRFVVNTGVSGAAED
jgi:PII-like signaling protein